MSKRGRYKELRRKSQAAHHELLVQSTYWGEMPIKEAFVDGVSAMHDVFAKVYSGSGGRAVHCSDGPRSYVAAQAMVETQLEYKGYAVWAN